MKPVCYYEEAILPPKLRQSAIVQVLQHPILGELGDEHLPSGTVITSAVVSIDGDEFETENTIYKRSTDAVS